MLHETSRRTALKLMAMGPVALTHPEALQALASQSSSPDVASAPPDTSPVPLDPAEFVLDGRAEGEPDAFAMLNRINRIHGERGTQMVEVDGVATYTEVFPLGEHNVEVVSETSTMRDGFPYQAGRISYIPDEEGDLSYTEFNFDSSGRVWVETPALHLSGIDLQSEEGVQYMIEALNWHEYAREFSPSTVWAGVDEAIGLLDDPDALSTFVQDQIEPMVGWDKIEDINMAFFPQDYEFEITNQGAEYLEGLGSEEDRKADAAMEKFQRGEGSVYSASDLDQIIALKKAKLSGWKSGISRVQLFHAFTALGGEVKRIFQGGTYTALPDEVRRILAGGGEVSSLEGINSQVSELATGEVVPTGNEEFASISSGFSFYTPEGE